MMAKQVRVTFKDINLETEEVMIGQLLAILPESSQDLEKVMKNKEAAEEDGTLISSGTYAAFFFEDNVIFIPQENLMLVEVIGNTN